MDHWKRSLKIQRWPGERVGAPRHRRLHPPIKFKLHQAFCVKQLILTTLNDYGVIYFVSATKGSTM